MTTNSIRTGFRFIRVALLLIAHCSLLIANAQDRPGTPPLLPFQTPATETSDEQLALQFFQNREYDKALPVYERLYTAKPGQNYYIYYFYCLVETRSFDQAEKLIRSLRKSEPGSLRYLVDLGYLYFREGDPEKARKSYEEAIKKLEPVTQQVYEVANAFLMRNELDYAIKTYQQGRELMKNPSGFGYELAIVYERTGEIRKMLDEYVALLETNRSYLQTIQDRLQFSLANDPDGSKNEIFRKYLLEKAQKEPDKTYYSELLWWYSIQQKDFGLALIQAKSLDRRLREDGTRVYQLAGLCVDNEEYDAAIDGYRYLVSKGADNPYYGESRRGLLNTRYRKLVSGPDPPLKSLEELAAEFRTEINAELRPAQAISLVRNLAHLDAFYLGKTDDAVAALEKAITVPALTPAQRAECKLELADILLFTGEVWEATLLYQQVYKDFKNDAIGQLAKFKNSKLSYYIGEFKWARDQLDILKAATSKLIANDAIALSLLITENYDSDSNTVALTLFSHADLLEYRNENEKALATLDSIRLFFTEHSIFDDVLLKKAEIRMKQGKYTDADTLLALLVRDYSDGVLADKALYMRGRLNEEQLKNPESARKFYEDLILGYPGSIYVIEARKRFRILRGDQGF